MIPLLFATLVTLNAVVPPPPPTDEECYLAYAIDLHHPGHQPMPEIIRRCLMKDKTS